MQSTKIPNNTEDIPIIMATPSSWSLPSSQQQQQQQQTNPTTSVSAFPTDPPEAHAVTIDDFANEVTPLFTPSRGQHGEAQTNGQTIPTSPSSVLEGTQDHHDDNNDNDYGVGRDEEEHNNHNKQNFDKPRFQDWPFALLFWIHIAIMIYVGIVYSKIGYERLQYEFNITEVEQAIANNDDDGIKLEDFQQFKSLMENVLSYMQAYPQRILLYTKIPAGFVALLLVDITLSWIVRPFTSFIIGSTLLCSISIATITMTALLILEPSIFGIIIACIVIGSVLYFTCTIWRLIPFVSINLEVALDGIGSNLGTYLWVLFFCYLCFLFVLLWFYIFFGLALYEHSICEDNKHPGISYVEGYEDIDNDCTMSSWSIILLFISLYWTINVIINFGRTVVAGVMATWLYAEEDARGCCSLAIWGSLQRSLTYSFGSICFGSLSQGLVSVLRWITSSAKRNRDGTSTHNECCGGLCFCIVDCVANLGGEALNYFSQWNYIYIALYGYSYIESGKAVMRLFEIKGWHLNTSGSQSIITERLTSYVLSCITISLGLLTGASTLVVERIVTYRNPDPDFESYVFGPMPHWRFVAFLIGFVIGVVISSIMMHVVKGAVNTLIVCLADNPSQIEEKHPDMARRLANAWADAFPHTTMQRLPQQRPPPSATPTTYSQ